MNFCVNVVSPEAFISTVKRRVLAVGSSILAERYEVTRLARRPLFVAWGNEARETLIRLCDDGMMDDKNVFRSSAFLDRAFYTGSLR